MRPPPPGSQLERELALAAAAEPSPKTELASLLAAVAANNREDPRYHQVQRLKMSSQPHSDERDSVSQEHENGQGGSSPVREEEQGAPSPEREEDEDAPSQGHAGEEVAPSSPAASPAADSDFQWYATDFQTGRDNLMVPKNMVPFKEGREDPQIPWEQRARFRSWVTTDRLRGVEAYNAGPGRFVGCLHCAEKGRDCVVQYNRAKCVPCDTLHAQCSRIQSFHEWRVCENMENDPEMSEDGGCGEFARFLHQSLYLHCNVLTL
ncbi:hypothetical protein PLICRDRAFT_180389 [Plicaturopsis crispa FD-325 SS-3]|uniref:Uncharacterized protein n=1 Tax=Plicaturopsis crispa FD-325 SS-3 TaxID=944288 RepID=A0A0C9SW42_PLICR|nr:hypothetical protein PLICRDRAFT_180389 [Plicaturopsis crispa FD-325 SS-3]